MLFSVFITSAPQSSQGALSAIKFCRAALAADHQLLRIFFSSDAVYQANQLACPSRHEWQWAEQWAELAQNHHFELVVCSAATLRRGIVNSTEAKRYQHQHHNLHPQFEIGGLGLLMDAMQNSDRLVTFH